MTEEYIHIKKGFCFGYFLNKFSKIKAKSNQTCLTKIKHAQNQNNPNGVFTEFAKQLKLFFFNKKFLKIFLKSISLE